MNKELLKEFKKSYSINDDIHTEKFEKKNGSIVNVAMAQLAANLLIIIAKGEKSVSNLILICRPK
jgi:hypothetical protein